MKQHVKKLWVEALRSGKYPQGTGYLNRNGKCCGMGVLAEVAVECGVATRDRMGATAVFYRMLDEEFGDPMQLTTGIAEWAGLRSAIPILATDSFRAPITMFNDEYGYSHAQLANLIEVQL